jgi:hypothetical protein
MAATRAGATSGDGRTARIAGAAAALVLAAAALAGAASVEAGDLEHPGAGEVRAGKVSVLGDAKVRRWITQRFSLEVPLEWALIEENTGTAFTWVRVRPGRTLDANVANGPWTAARRIVSDRLRVEPARVPKLGARGNMRDRGRLEKDGYVDSGGVPLPRPNSRYAFRLLVTVPGFDPKVANTVEGHYFFATCFPPKTRRDTWHVTYDRDSLRGQAAAEQQAAFERIIGSFETIYPASPPGKADCRPRPATR